LRTFQNEPSECCIFLFRAVLCVIPNKVPQAARPGNKRSILLALAICANVHLGYLRVRAAEIRDDWIGPTSFEVQASKQIRDTVHERPGSELLRGDSPCTSFMAWFMLLRNGLLPHQNPGDCSGCIFRAAW
jgi:hypothetical protein